MGGQRRRPEPDTPEPALGAALDAALAHDSSPLARTLRNDLAEITARLVLSLTNGSSDTEAPEVRRTIEVFEQTLRGHLRRPQHTAPGAVEIEGAVDPDAAVHVTEATPGPDLDAIGLTPVDHVRGLVDEVNRDPRCLPYVSARRPAADVEPAELWEWLHLQVLRLPRGAGIEVRASALGLAGAEEDGRLIPSSTAMGHPGWSSDAEVRHQVLERLGAVAPDWQGLTGLVVDVLSVLRRSPDLVTGHSGWARETDQRLSSDLLRRDHEQIVLDAVSVLAKAPLPFDAVVGVDEAVRSVFPYPLPAPDSWWAGLGRSSAQILTELAPRFGAEVVVLDPQHPPTLQQLDGQLDIPGRVMIRVPRHQAGRFLWQLRLGYRFPGDDAVASGKGARILVGEAQ